MTSDPGDWVGQGRSYSFSTPGNLFFARSSQGGSDLTVTAQPDGSSTGEWVLELAAPFGQQLVPGTYTGAVRASERGTSAPGLDVSSELRGCSSLTGSFTVLDVSEPTKSGDRTGAIVLGLGRCPTTPVPWSVTVPPSDPKSPFVKGPATVHAVARLRDLFYGDFVDAGSVTATTFLREC